MTRPTIGDVIEIPTSAGLGYAQYSHDHASYGELLRVLPGTFDGLPSRLPELVEGVDQFLVFSPLGVAIREGLVRVVATLPVPAHRQAFPVMRSGGLPGEPRYLWDGERAVRVRVRRSSHRRLSHAEIVSHPVLVERIETGWRPEDEPW